MSRLSIDEWDELKDLLTHPGMKVLFKLMGECTESIQMDVLTFNLSTGDERELIRRHCRAEGAVKMLHAVKARCESLRAKKES